MSKTEERPEFLFKVVLLGDSGVGKSQLMARYTRHEFDDSSKATIGVEFARRDTVIEGHLVSAQIWDTAGEEKYKSLSTLYYQGAAGALIAYDITKARTFEHVNSHWFKELEFYSSPSVIKVLVGNKVDLQDQREVQTATAETYAKQNGIGTR